MKAQRSEEEQKVMEKIYVDKYVILIILCFKIYNFNRKKNGIKGQR